MKKVIEIISLVVLCFVLSIVFISCEKTSSGTGGVGVSKTVALSAAKQQVVDECCAEADVTKISIVYGSESAFLEGKEWTVFLSGTFYPIDRYGNYDDETMKFDMVIKVSAGGIARTYRKTIR